MVDLPVLTDAEDSKTTVRFFSVYNLLTFIAVFTFILVILCFIILGLLLNGEKCNNVNQNAIAQPSTAFLNASQSIALLPPFTQEWNWNGNIYRYYMGDNLVSWWSALSKCKEQGFKLLDLDSVEERDFLLGKIKVKENSGIPIIDDLHVWTSGYRDYNLTHWLWESTGKSVIHHLWSPGEPNNGCSQGCERPSVFEQKQKYPERNKPETKTPWVGNERCICLLYGNELSFMLADGLCSRPGRYICARKH